VASDDDKEEEKKGDEKDEDEQIDTNVEEKSELRDKNLKKKEAFIEAMKKQIVFSQEFYITSELEIKSLSRLYMKQARKILNEIFPDLSKEYAAMRQKQLAAAEASESSDADEDGELVDTLWTNVTFGNAEKDEKKA
jgi:hypothetical protein